MKNNGDGLTGWLPGSDPPRAWTTQKRHAGKLQSGLALSSHKVLFFPVKIDVMPIHPRNAIRHPLTQKRRSSLWDLDCKSGGAASGSSRMRLCAQHLETHWWQSCAPAEASGLCINRSVARMTPLFGIQTRKNGISQERRSRPTHLNIFLNRSFSPS